MHEYSVAFAIVEQVKKIALEHNALKVKKVTVSTSPYEMIVPDLLCDAYEIIIQEPEFELLEGSILQLLEQEKEIVCLKCNYKGAPASEGDPEFTYNFKCPECSSRDTQINFKSMIIESIDLELP